MLCNSQDVILADFLQKVIADTYHANLISRKMIQEKRREKLHQDNARPPFAKTAIAKNRL